MTVKIKKRYTWCDECATTIYVGDDMWFKGDERYCGSKCLMASFGTSTRDKEREQAIARQKRLDMMEQVIERRMKARAKL